MRKKRIFASAAILTVAGIITRFLGFFYRVYMSNVIGAEGVGLYQLVTPIYFLAWSISCSGFTTTISKLTAEENAKGEYGNMGRVVKQCVAITFSIGFILSVITYFFADAIALDFLKDERVIIPLRILSVSFPFMAIGSSVRGYFFGLQKAAIPAISQVLEQAVRMAVVFILSGSFLKKGLLFASIATILGIVAGEVISCLQVVFSYLAFKRKNSYVKKPSLSSGKTLQIIAAMAIPLSMNRIISSLLGTVENALIPQRLALFGLSHSEALAAYGKITGMASPLIYFPTAFLTSLSISLLPAVSEVSAVGKTKNLRGMINKTFLLTSVVGMCCSALFMVFNRELGELIYNQDISRALFLMGFMCPFIYAHGVASGILSGLGEQMFIFIVSVISSLVSIAFIYFLVPLYGMDAFLASWFLTCFGTCAAYAARLARLTGVSYDFRKLILYPMVCALAAGLTVNYFVNNVIDKSSLAPIILSITLLFAIYAALLSVTGCVGPDELRVLKPLNIFSVKGKINKKNINKDKTRKVIWGKNPRG
jgi:stage V sporulation protein B